MSNAITVYCTLCQKPLVFEAEGGQEQEVLKELQVEHISTCSYLAEDIIEWNLWLMSQNEEVEPDEYEPVEQFGYYLPYETEPLYVGPDEELDEDHPLLGDYGDYFDDYD